MIYLIESSGYKRNGNVSYFSLLKIGYTEDNNKNLRFSAYKLHNPTCQVLYEIPDGTENDEDRIQYKFRDFLFPDYGREWFMYSEEIINFFKTATLEDIRNLPERPNKTVKDFYILKNRCKRILESIFSIRIYLGELKSGQDYRKDIRELSNKIANRLKDSDNDNILGIIEELYGNIILEEYKNLQKTISESPKLSNFIKEFYNTLKVQDKLKLIVESNLDEESLDYIFKQIDPFFGNYYKVLGPEKLKGWRYNLTDIAREYSKLMFDKNSLINSIYSEFKEGEKYELSEIKTKLFNLYESIGYLKTPKATDLEDYFELKKCKITNQETKIRTNGLELIKRKY